MCCWCEHDAPLDLCPLKPIHLIHRFQHSKKQGLFGGIRYSSFGRKEAGCHLSQAFNAFKHPWRKKSWDWIDRIGKWTTTLKYKKIYLGHILQKRDKEATTDSATV